MPQRIAGEFPLHESVADQAIVHTIDIEVASIGLPLVIEVVDTAAHIDRVLPKLEPLITDAVVTLERAHVICYTKSTPTA